ncbi:MAG TPA: hypothetical protein VK599_02445 [Streptosporangiaceae bacterium]|jgi:hypothetical protein|nr:hypothetical protein [Streptosporangiaceae bacterium]
MVTDSDPQPPPPGDPQPDDEPSGSPPVEPPEGGETACWAHLVCPECGAMTTEGHRPSCAFAKKASG